MSDCTLFIAGTPLDENAPLSASARAAAENCKVIIGESRGVMMRFLKGMSLEGKELFNLDPMRKETLDFIAESLEALKKTGGQAMLFSDTGMPMLFDPGVEVLGLCRKLGFQIRSTEGATSWGMACALSGWEPPFLVLGFPPRDSEERMDFLRSSGESPGHLVLMDTPYRFQALLENAGRALGNSREAFLAWEITKPGERLLWGSLGDLANQTKRLGLEKGEFILLVKGQARKTHPPKGRRR